MTTDTTQPVADGWPFCLAVTRVRVARPTDRLAAVEKFYSADLGLRVVYRFENHAGYDGVMLGLPGTDYHLEFTTHVDGSPCPAPTRDNLLVMPRTPYWADTGALTFEDPDGWRVVLVPKRVF